MKKVLSMTLVLCMLMSLFAAVPATASAAVVESGVCGDNLTWTLDDAGTLTISGTGRMKAPNAWKGNANIKCVVIQSGVESIDTGAFRACSNLESVDIADSVWSIDDLAFADCKKLTDIDLPDQLRTVGVWSFSGAGLKTITFPKAIGSIRDRAFEGCENLETLVIEECAPEEDQYGCTIGYHAFWNCTNLKTVKIQKKIGTLEWLAFDGCIGLTSVEIDEVSVIEQLAFGSCINLKNVSLGSNLTSIGENVFKNCTSLENIYYGGDKESWESAGGANASDVDLSGVLRYNAKMTDLEDSTGTSEPSKTEEPEGIPDQASGKCGENLVWVYDGNGTLTISGTGRMYNYTTEKPWHREYSDGDITRVEALDVDRVIIEEGVTSVGEHAFSDMNIKEVQFPESLIAIERYAFTKCDKLTNIWIPQNVSRIEGFAIWQCDGIYVDERNPYYSSDEYGVLFNKDKTVLVQYPANRQGAYNIPAGTKRIEDYAFFCSEGLTNITFPDGLIDLGTVTFEGCSNLEGKIVIPDSVCVDLGKRVFEDCDKITEVVIGKNIKTIRSEAFDRCTSLQTVKFSKGLTLIEQDAFGSCKKLTDIYYEGSEEEWKNIIVEEKNDLLLNATKHYNTVVTDGIPENSIHDRVQTNVELQSGYYTYAILDEIPWDGVMILKVKDYPYTDIEIPEMINGYPVTVIALEAFKDTGITDITFPKTVNKIGVKLYLSDDNFDGSQSISDCLEATQIRNVHVSSSAYESVDGILYSGDKKELLWRPNGREETQFSIPVGTERIDFDAFSRNNWEDTLTKIWCPEGVVLDAPQLFSACKALTDIYYQGTRESWLNVRADEERLKSDNVTVHYLCDEIPIEVYLNSRKIAFDVAPLIVNERTLVPVRAIFEAMGMEIGWDDATQTVTATGNGNSLSLQINNTTATVNGQTMTMDVPPQIINERTLVPVRFVSESVGAKVDWDANTKTVFIEYGMGNKSIHISAINCEKYAQKDHVIWIQPHQYVAVDVVDDTGYYVDPSRYTIESNNPFITIDEYRTLTAKCENEQFGILYLKDSEGKTISSVNVHVVNDVATRNFAVNNLAAIASLQKKRSFDLWGSFQKNNGLKWGVAEVYEFYQDPIGYIGEELNYQKQMTASLIDALTSDRALEILQQKIEQEYIDNWYEITMDVYDVGQEDLSKASKEYLAEARNKLVMHQKDVMAKRAVAYAANNGKASAFDVYVDDVERSEAIVQELDWTGKELDKIQEQLKDITKNEKFLKRFENALEILDVADDFLNAMEVSQEQKQMIVALQDVKEQYVDGLSLCAQQTNDPYFKQACLDAVEIMNLSFEEAQRNCFKKGFEHFVGEGLKETIEGAIEKVSEVAIKKAVEVIMTNLGASAEQISAAVGSVGTTAGMFAKAKLTAKVTAGVCNFFGSTSDSIRASLDLKTLLTIEQEMSVINEQYLREIANGNNRINEYVATAEVLKPIMIYACGLTNTIYNAEMNNRWDVFVRTMKGEEGYDDDFDRMYSDEVNGINNIQFVLY